MSLTAYRRKRDFSQTPEPRGERLRATSGGNRPARQPEVAQTAATGRQFVVQKHAASRLHYDFRLELEGVLKSWAVPKGPSLDPEVRSLAVEVEDHPVEYGSFEGTIPAGEYGGGTVMLWDRGAWLPEGDPAAGYRKGKLRFELRGEKLRGRWSLVRMGGRAGDDGKNWLLIKGHDRHSRPVEEFDLLREQSLSIVSQRTLEQIATAADATAEAAESESLPRQLAALPSVRRGTPPPKLSPQLPTLTTAPPTGDAWLHELKLDGYRVLAHLEAGRARLLTRRGHDWTDRFGGIAREIERLGLQEAIVDGEVVVLKRDGTTNFQALQNAMQPGGEASLTYFAFDLPYCEGYDLTHTPLVERKRMLEAVLKRAGFSEGGERPIRYSGHILGQGEQMLAHACRAAAEGIVSKRADSGYIAKRSQSWLKAKCIRRQEFVIGGYTESPESGRPFGALLLGYHDAEGRLVYCGRVGTGFNAQSLEQIAGELQPLRSERSPFDVPPTASERRSVRWVEPKLVAEVAFAQWTDDDRLRHASFQGLREDKHPRHITREQPKSMPSASKPPRPEGNGSGATEWAGVRLSNAGRVLYPEQGLTKADLAEYYAAVADWVLPHVIERPLAVVRCPRGRTGHCFFQKHANESVPPPVKGIEIQEQAESVTYLAIADLPGLITLVQLGVLEIHPWGSRGDRPERPDRLVLDLDPDEEVAWPEVVRAAADLRDMLSELGLTSFLRTTGGKGLHLVVPITRRSSWSEVKQFARDVAEAMVRREPERYIATGSKARRRGKIYVDYLRNSRGATAVASYSTRARPGAPVAAPLRWDELTADLDPSAFHVKSMPERLQALDGDPWEGFFEVRQSLTKSARERIRRL